MTTDLVTVEPTDTAQNIREIFEQSDFHHLPVVTLGNQLTGIISKDDFRKFYYGLSHNTTGKTLTGLELSTVKAEEIMTRFPVSLDPEDSIGLAADIFMANKFHALPVTEDNQLIGIVTTHDLLAYSFKSATEPSETVQFRE